jgi:hypothetical protein
MNIETDVTNRGFALLKFEDSNGLPCTLQDSSTDTPSIWLGTADARPQIMRKDTPEGGTGWTDYPIPDEVLLSTRMHLTQEQVQELLPYLQFFAETGQSLNDYKETVDEEDTNKHVTILNHDISYFFRDTDILIDDSGMEHIAYLITQDFIEGDLTVTDPNDTELTYHGYWHINKG